jgi:integrase
LLIRGEIPRALIFSVVQGLPSPHSRKSYRHSIEAMYAFAAGRPVTLALLQEWKIALAMTKSTATVNARIAAVRRLIQEAQRTGFLGTEEAFELLQIDGMPMRGVRQGNWLTLEQTRRLLAVPQRKTLRGARNYCILAVLVGCALRLDELAGLELPTLQQRDGRWVFADLVGKGGRRRTVAVPGWVKAAIDNWTRAAAIREGKLVRRLTLAAEGMSTEGIREIVQKTAQVIGAGKVSPHDLRRTCAKLCRDHGGELEQIQEMLGHADISTTQKYLGTVQRLAVAVNDKMGL